MSNEQNKRTKYSLRQAGELTAIERRAAQKLEEAIHDGDEATAIKWAVIKEPANGGVAGRLGLPPFSTLREAVGTHAPVDYKGITYVTPRNGAESIFAYAVERGMVTLARGMLARKNAYKILASGEEHFRSGGNGLYAAILSHNEDLALYAIDRANELGVLDQVIDPAGDHSNYPTYTTPIMAAVRANMPRVISRLLDLKPELIHCKVSSRVLFRRFGSGKDESLLEYAQMFGSWDAFNLLVERAGGPSAIKDVFGNKDVVSSYCFYSALASTANGAYQSAKYMAQILKGQCFEHAEHSKLVDGRSVPDFDTRNYLLSREWAARDKITAETERYRLGLLDIITQFKNHVLLPAFCEEMGPMPPPGEARDQYIRRIEDILKWEENRREWAKGDSKRDATTLDAVAMDLLAPPPAKLAADEVPSESWLQQALRPLSLSTAWHHPINIFPTTREYLPEYHAIAEAMAADAARKAEAEKKKVKGEWDSLLGEDFSCQPNGAAKSLKGSVTCLTLRKALLEESDGAADGSNKGLKHCVGWSTNYANGCLKGEFHILSIRDNKGQRLSTAQVEIVNAGDLENKTYDPNSDYIPIKGTKVALHVMQHRGYQNRSPSPEAAEIWDGFKRAIYDGSYKLAITWQKKTDENRPQLSLLQSIGYIPSWEHIDKCFNVFKNPLRRAASGLDNNGNLIFENDAEKATGNKNALTNNFIDGYAIVTVRNKENMPTGKWALMESEANDMIARGEVGKPDGNTSVSTYALRNLDAKSWLRATGAMERIRGIIRDYVGHEEAQAATEDKLPGDFLGQREAAWKEEDKEPLVRRKPERPTALIEGGGEPQGRGLEDGAPNRNLDNPGRRG